MSRIVDTIRREAEQRSSSGGSSRPRRYGDPDVGVVQYFHKDDRETVRTVLDGLAKLPVRRLRTAISWCDWTSPGGEEWYRWLLPQLIERFEVMPCFLYTPPELGILPKTSSPPRDPRAYGEFVAMVLDRHAGDFPSVELWNEPNNYIEWDWTIDPEWKIFAEMIAGAAEQASAAGSTAVLGGMSPFDPNWLDLMFKRGAMEQIGVVGVHGFPGTWEAVWEGWDTHIDRVLEVLDRHDSPARVWVTEAGFSTWAHDEFRQLQTMVDLAVAPADRVYWYSAQDLAPERETLDGFHCDERAYHFGMQRADGSPKLLARVLADRGLDGVRELVRFAEMEREGAAAAAVLITGGAGRVGGKLAGRLASEGRRVTIFDSLTREGAEQTMRTLKEEHGDLVRAVVGDIRDVFAVRRALEGAERIFHLVSPAADDPETAFEVEARGTLTLLEELRRSDDPPPLVFGSIAGNDEPSHPRSIAKAAAEQYVRGYARSFGLRTCALRVGEEVEASEAVDALLTAAEDPERLDGEALDVEPGIALAR